MDPLTVTAALFVLAVVLLLRLPLALSLRRLLLLAGNAVFLGTFHLLAPAVLLLTTLLGYLAARLAARGARAPLLIGCALPLVVLLFLPKFLVDVSASDVTNVVGARAALFVGTSYFTLRALSFVLDARRTGTLRLGFVDFLVYNSFFPMLIAGPIERADHFAKSYDQLGRASGDDLWQGVVRIFLGLLKKVLLGSIVASYAQPLHAFVASGDVMAAKRAWIALYAFVVYTYLDFAGYSDLAIGVARLMGIRLAENFDHPFLRPSIAEFWRGWHISLSFFIRDYLFLPLCGKSSSPLRPHLAALTSMTLCGLWHAPNLGWALWGLAHGAGLSVHQAWTLWLRKRYRIKVKLQRSLAFRALGIFLTFNFVALSWVLTIGGNRLDVVARYLGLLFPL